MSHTAETTTTFTDMLKYGYDNVIIQATPEQSVLMKKLELITESPTYGGKSITFPLLKNSMGSVASLGEGSSTDALPANLPGNFDNAVVPIDYHYMGMAVTGQTIRMSQDPQFAFAKAWALETDVKLRSFRQHINRQLCGDGNAILCQVDGAISGQTITVDNAGGWSGFHASAVNGAQFLTANQYVQARDSSGTVHDAGLKISSISTLAAYPSTSAVITVVGTCSSVADGDYLYASASATASNDSYGHETPGVKVLIDDGTVASTVQSIDCSTDPEWQSYVGYGSIPGTAEAITPMRLMTLASQIQAGGGGQIDFMCTSPGVLLELGNLADSSNQIMNATTYELGFPLVTFMGVPIFMDPYLADEIYFIDKRALAMYQPAPAGWFDANNDGNYITQTKGASAAYDQIEAYWYWYMTLGIKNRRWCGKMTDITVNANWKL